MLEELKIKGDEACGCFRRETASYIKVGAATCGRSAGALEVLDAFREAARENSVKVTISEVGCMGHCYAEPMVEVRKPGWPPILYGYFTPGKAKALIKRFFLDDDPGLEWAMGAMERNDLIPSVLDTPRFGKEYRAVLKRCGRIDPENMYQYIANGGYEGLAKSLEMGPDEVISVIDKSGLRGLGGAGFPTGKKWKICKMQKADAHYVVCNADEGDPGAFMDRTLLESDPHSILEGLMIAGFAIGAKKGLFYVRNEYPLAVERIEKAIENARNNKILGDGVLGSDFSFEVEVIQGAGAFVCGEETALIASLEGNRGMPRPRPPFPAQAGVFGKPTVVNNVKTLANVSYIMRGGAERFASVGTGSSKGTALFALAGKIRNPGLVEIPMGTSLREIVMEIGGGVPPVVKASELAGSVPKRVEKKFKGVQIGGPSGGCLNEDLLDTPVDFDSLQSSGAMMGSGGMVILDEDNCAVATAKFFLQFTQKESCGKCTFCRIGTKHMLDILEKFAKGQGSEQDLENLESLARDVSMGSLCNLGKTAPNPILSTLRYCKDEYRAHFEEKRCPSMECQDLIAYYIDPKLCQKTCDACVGSCPTEAIFTRPDGIKAIEQEKCVKCDSCIQACPPQYDAIYKVSPIDDLPEEAKNAAPVQDGKT
ncbi:MAG: NADH-quinone oxidoreductase subunit F [Deltaproteobacteria bacterium]|nr:NADH-quinone oxidoreductase subunit F [Deltaproteobacteria bacterium]